MSAALRLSARQMDMMTSALLVGLVLACVWTGILWVLRNPVFSITHIVVSGDTEHSSAASLQASVLPQLTGNFFSVDLAAAQQAFQSVPWVRKALVQREFPGKLNVHLQEHLAAARWGEGDAQLLSAAGEIFEVNASDVEDVPLPRLLGPAERAATVLQAYRQLQPLVGNMGLALTRLELGVRGDWRAQLDKGVDVELGQGTPQELAARLYKFAATAAAVTARHRRGLDAIESADLRYPGGYAMRLRGITTVRSGVDGLGMPAR